MKKLITIILLLIVLKTQAQYRTYPCSFETSVNSKTYPSAKGYFKIAWMNNQANNIDNILSIKIGSQVFKVLDDFMFYDKTDNMIIQKAHIIDNYKYVHDVYFYKNIDYKNTKFAISISDGRTNILILSDLDNFTFN